MFYIVETTEQLQKLVDYGNTKAFIEIIPMDDRIHPGLNKPSLVYFRPLAPVASKRGFIISVDHLEAFNLDYNRIMALLLSKVPEIWTIDKKNTLYYGFEDKGLNSLKMAYVLSGIEPVASLATFDTRAHRFYAHKLAKRMDINRFVPISKHYEKYENFFKFVKIPDLEPIDQEFRFYNDRVTRAFYNLEKNGIGINTGKFTEEFPHASKFMSISGEHFHTKFNLYNNTARPTTKFGGINLMALKKKGESRETFIPKNDFFVEFDYNAYQMKLLADHIGYDFADENIHEHMAKYYFSTETPTEEEYDAGKLLTFKYSYGSSDQPPEVPFFKKVYEERDRLWNFCQIHGFIRSGISNRKLFGIEKRDQVLPYLMQAHETERNVRIMEEIDDFLSDKKTKFVLYIYDAFLFDVSKEDGSYILERLKEIIEQGNYKTTIKTGKNYHELQEI